MKSRELAQLQANVGQIINLGRELNANKESIEKHTITKKQGIARLDGYTKQYDNKEYMATLSPAEQKCLMDNAQNVHMTIQKLDRELDYLDMSKQNSFIINALSQLDHAFLLVEYLIDDMGKTGETILPHLTCIKTKTFEGGKYRNQIDSIYAEVEAIAYDFYTDHVKGGITNLMAVSISDHLTVASMWLKREKERLEVEKPVEASKIELPAETIPEVPKAPEETK